MGENQEIGNRQKSKDNRQETEVKKYRLAIIVLVLLVLANVLVHLRVFRWDLTDDKIYSLSEASKELLRKTDAPIEVTLMLSGDLNSGFRRLKKATQETLEEMDVYGAVRFLPSTVSQQTADSLGLQPTVILEREHNGKTSQTMIYPYALITYQGKTAVVQLLQNTLGLSGEENLNSSIEQLEYTFMEALYKLLQTDVQRVAILEGHNEPDEIYSYDLENALNKYFQVDRGSINGDSLDIHILDDYQAIIVANPQSHFGTEELFVIDQYIMRGGSVLWAVDGVEFSDELLQSQGKTPIIEHEIGLKELFYHYGIQIYPALVQDVQCMTIPVNVSQDSSQPNFQSIPWTYAPQLQTNPYHPVTQNLGPVMSTFVSPIYPVNVQDSTIDKIVLLYTSMNTRLTAIPNEVDLNSINPDWNTFTHAHIPVAVALEGQFPSLYAHRMKPEGVISDEPIRKRSGHARQVVIGTGSVLMNEVDQQHQPVPMGYDRYNNQQFSNRDFAVNAILWLTDGKSTIPDAIIRLRSKTVPLRLLNNKRAYDERTKVELVSTVCPIAILLLLGGIVFIVRKKKYSI